MVCIVLYDLQIKFNGVFIASYVWSCEQLIVQ